MSNCIIKQVDKQTLNIWWQGKNSGSPKHTGTITLNYQGGSGEDNMLFNGKMEASGSTYNFDEARVVGDTFTFTTTTFDRPGRTGRESYLIGSGTCGPTGVLGEFHYVDEDDEADIYYFNFSIY